MQWSKLKTRVKALICPELRGRIDFHITSYRYSHDAAEKAWVTVDGQRLWTASWYQAQWNGWPRDEQGRLIWGSEPGVTADHHPFLPRPQDLGEAMRTFLGLPVQEALCAADPLVRALARIDRRIGARTLQSLTISETDHPLIKSLHTLRLNATLAPGGAHPDQLKQSE